MDSDIKEICFEYREVILNNSIGVKALMQHSDIGKNPVATGEMKANIMLAYRHLEDARMRLGKVVQAYDGGTSCYPR